MVVLRLHHIRWHAESLANAAFGYIISIGWIPFTGSVRQDVGCSEIFNFAGERFSNLKCPAGKSQIRWHGKMVDRLSIRG